VTSLDPHGRTARPWEPVGDFIAHVFPFHVVFDRELRTVQVGRSISRLCSTAVPGGPLQDFLSLSSPRLPLAFDTLASHPESLFLFRTKPTDAVLRGQVVPFLEGALLCFIGSPWLDDPSDLQRLGLSLSDFAIHDPLADFLFRLQAETTARHDAERLAERLRQLAQEKASLAAAQRGLVQELAGHRGRLEELVHARTAELLAANAALERARQEIAERGERFRLLFERNPVAMCTVDTQTWRFLSVNQAAIDLYGYSREEFLSMTVCDLRAADDWDSFLQSMPLHRAGAMSTYCARNVRKDGQVIHVDLVVDDIDMGEVQLRLVAIRDVTEQRRLEAELRDRAFHDALTGLANRALLADRFAHAQTPRGSSHRPLAIVLIDLDDFKVVNDTVGHGMGDELLRGVARRIESVVRPQDTVARMGGDEFAVLLEDVDMAATEEIVTRLLVALADPIVVGRNPVEVTASAGVTAVTHRQVTWDTAFREADLALSTAKADGKGRVRIYESGMQNLALVRLEVAHELQRALGRHELTFHYQPLVSVSAGTPVHRVDQVEALLRWTHPTRGPMSPADFISIAEESGVIVPLGAWVLRTACQQLAEWQSQGRRLRLSVNVSGRQLRDPGFVHTVAEVLDRTRVPASSVILEVTETAMMENLNAARHTLASLRAMGMRIALDDFGAGYSSFAYLRELPLDEVKIDRLFITDLEDADRRATILTMVRLLDTLGVRTVAEGVETTRQLDYVTSLGIDARACSSAGRSLRPRCPTSSTLPAPRKRHSLTRSALPPDPTPVAELRVAPRLSLRSAASDRPVSAGISGHTPRREVHGRELQPHPAPPRRRPAAAARTDGGYRSCARELPAAPQWT